MKNNLYIRRTETRMNDACACQNENKSKHAPKYNPTPSLSHITIWLGSSKTMKRATTYKIANQYFQKQREQLIMQ